MSYPIIIKQDDFQKARNEIRKNSDKRIIFTSDNDETNRKVLENEKIDILLLNQKFRKDKSKQKDSGLNHILAKIAKKANISIGINLDEIIESDKRQKAEILGRIMQNIKLCKKSDIRMKFISIKKYKKDVYDLKSLAIVLKMPTNLVKDIELL